MPRSSRASLSDETVQELENQFYEFLNSLSSDERKKFFAEFLTNEEKMMMYKRLALYWCLLEGYSLAKIQQMIGVTHDTTRVYNKRKNTLSEDFKGLVGRIGKADMATLEEPVQDVQDEPIQEVIEEKMEEKVEEKEEAMDDTSVNLDPDAPIETRPIDEPMDVTPEEKMEEMTKNDEKEDLEDEEIKMDEKDEKESEETLRMDAMPTFDDQKDDMEKEEKEVEGLMPESASEKNEDEDKDDDGEGEKKKSGLAKFFGF